MSYYIDIEAKRPKNKLQEAAINGLKSYHNCITDDPESVHSVVGQYLKGLNVYHNKCNSLIITSLYPYIHDKKSSLMIKQGFLFTVSNLLIFNFLKINNYIFYQPFQTLIYDDLKHKIDNSIIIRNESLARSHRKK